jgi:cyclopropane-fatty-acyl-phospholipid synthase
MTSATPAYAGASAAAIRHHYDLSNDFFALWLDPTLTYSCALWEPGDTLQRAQERKLDYLLEGAGASGARRVLDIGCGWGSALRRLTEVHGVQHAVGLSLSEEQVAYVDAHSGARAEVRLENWADHEPDEPYDAIVSIGAFEHFASYGLSRADRIEAYRRFFARCRELLVPGGRLALQTNAKGANTRLDRRTAAELRFMIETIFPESELPWMSEIAQASERMFELESARNDAAHYALTCAAWRDGLRANRDAAEALVGRDVAADYDRYLTSTVGHFERRHLALLRLILSAVPPTQNGAAQ